MVSSSQDSQLFRYLVVNILYFIADLIDFCHFFSLSLSLVAGKRE
jgi:hypothetical protein